MNRQHRFKGQPVSPHENGDQSRRPIVHMQDLHARGQPSRQFQRCFAKQNEARGVIFVGFTVLAVESGAIEEFVASDQEQLHSAWAAPFQILGDVALFANANIDGHPTVLLLKRGVLADLAIERQRHAHVMPPRAQLARKCVHHVDQRAGVPQRRSLRADHQDSHPNFIFDF